MKQIDWLQVTSSGGKPSLDTNQVRTSLQRAGFREGDLVSVVLTSDLSQVPASAEAFDHAASSQICSGQRRTLNHDPQLPFTIIERDADLSGYWRVKFDDNPFAREGSFGEEYIAKRSTVVEEVPATEPTTEPPFRWWICFQGHIGPKRGPMRRVLARTSEGALSLANEGHGYADTVVPL